MSASYQVIRSQRVVMDGTVRPAAIALRDEHIEAVGGYDDFQSSGEQTDFGNSVIMPGLVDSHVHINEPGRTDWEGFASATKAAAAGGVTTMIDMPLNSIPAVTSLHGLTAKIEAATSAATQGRLAVDVGFWGGVVPGNTRELRAMHAAGVFGFKCFLVPSGVPEFAPVNEAALREAMPELTSLGVPLLVHAELPEPIAEASRSLAGQDPRSYSTWLRSRPHRAEDEAIELMIALSREFGTRVHVVHLSSAIALDALREARTGGVQITVETCPHYLAFAAEDIPDGATEFKCAPPIRERENQGRLWEALRDGLIDLLASDHSPAPPAMKCCESGDFMAAWGGIASLQLSLPILWTEARQRGFTIPYLAQWLCRGPANLAGLRRKGEIKPGCDADFVVWDPEASFRLEPNLLQHRHKLTPYAGRTLYGEVQHTFLRGQPIYASGRFKAGQSGRILTRGAA